MEFKKVYEALKQGHKIKREHWRGYWVKENGTITMHCKDGSVIPFLETEDIFVDLDNIVADNWIICDDIDEFKLNIQTFTFGEAISNLKRGKDMEKDKILAEIICKEMTERKLTLKDLVSATSIVVNKFVNDAVIRY